VKIQITNLQIILISFLIFAFFCIFSLSNFLLGKIILGLILLFFIPGYLITLSFTLKKSFIETVVFSFALSPLIILVLIFFLNLVLKLSINNYFLLIVFFVALLISSTKFYFSESTRKKFILQAKKPNKLDVIFLVIIIFSLLVRIALFLNVHTILGADVGRFTIISHTFILKQTITPDLRPYDLANGFFYFPGSFIMPMILELIGLDPISGVTLMVFFFDLMSLFAFYLLTKKFFNQKIATTALFFYSFLFDALLNLSVWGVFPEALSILYLFLLMMVTLDLFFQGKKNFFLLIFFLLGIFSFHLYVGFIFLAFFLSLISYEIIIKKKINKSKTLIFEFLKACLVILILISPFLFFFGKYIFISFSKPNIADLKAFSSGREGLPFSEKIIQIFFATPTGLGISYSSVIGLIFLLVTLKKWLNTNKMILLIYFFYLNLFSFFVFGEYNLFRGIFGNWIIYSFAIAIFLDRPIINFALLAFFFFVESSSPLFLFISLRPMANPPVPWVIWPDYSSVIQFIKNNVPLNATFLIDGGGTGCTGANPSYGERIFPLTSRKIFYFTDYCWAQYNITDYENRVDLYRRLSINPNDKIALFELKDYNVTHVYIGPYSIGLNSTLFLNSNNYKLIFEKDGSYVFTIN
jgi:hypothetical protein